MSPARTGIAVRDAVGGRCRPRVAPPGVGSRPGGAASPRVEVTTSLASAEIYLQGAHVTAYAPRGARRFSS